MHPKAEERADAIILSFAGNGLIDLVLLLYVRNLTSTSASMKTSKVAALSLSLDVGSDDRPKYFIALNVDLERVDVVELLRFASGVSRGPTSIDLFWSSSILLSRTGPPPFIAAEIRGDMINC